VLDASIYSQKTCMIEQKIQENSNLIVSVKTDRETKYDVFVQVLDELKVANATRISIAEPTG